VMAGIDSLLRMLTSSNADELRVGTDMEPRMLSRGTPLRLSIPAIDEATLRHLLDGVLTPEREQVLRDKGLVELVYTSGSEPFQATFKKGPPLEASFRRGGGPAQKKPDPVPAPVAAPRTPSRQPPREGALRDLLALALERRASDLHLCAGEPPTLRIDGRLH